MTAYRSGALLSCIIWLVTLSTS